MIHFRILDETLCGAPYTEPSAKAAKDGRLCNDCIQVMWKEQYRRNTLMPYIKKARKVKVNEDNVIEEYDDSEERESRLYLMDFKKP